MSESDTLISADNVSIIRDQNIILDGISIEIKPGEFTTIIGPNGAGKTVLLNVLMGLIAPDKGEITRKEKLKIGYVPQNFSPEKTMPITVHRFLELVKGTSKEVIRKHLHDLGIDNITERMLYNLSGGELQRVLLARALLHNPDLLMLDEPAQNLDIGSQLSFYKMLDKIYQEKKCSIMMVSHDLHMVMASTNRVLCLYHHICCSGEPKAVAADPKFINLFGQDTAKMMASYQHIHTHEHNNA